MTLLVNLNTFEASQMVCFFHIMGQRGNLVWFGELDWVPTSYSQFIIILP